MPLVNTVVQIFYNLFILNYYFSV